eukprot:TRINITY_DN5634_c0_g2_i2.p4 TRINITY_DN5634_c0_g2~~TRINITY_DN5634_c0_g2_i2.p4  ORF type:complete len:104 (-),score=43.28 TRINITY_DN5634_c0_g2_i2:764-1075(-)
MDTSLIFFFFLMIRRPPRSTHCISSAASDVYKRQTQSTWVYQKLFLFLFEKRDKQKEKEENDQQITSKFYQIFWISKSNIFQYCLEQKVKNGINSQNSIQNLS